MTTEPGEVREVASGVHHVARSRVSWYVLVDDGEVTLVDAGYPGDTDGVLDALGQIGRTPSDVTAVLVTHGHADHIGAAELLRREHGATVLTHVDEEPNVTGHRRERITYLDLALRIWRPSVFGFVVNALRAGGAAPEHVTEVTTFGSDAAALDVPGRPVPVPTPGHTSGHCAFHLPDRGALITGDGLVTLDVLSLETGPRLLPRPFNHHHPTTIASLNALREIDAEVVLPGHGAPFHGSPEEAVDLAVARLG